MEINEGIGATGRGKCNRWAVRLEIVNYSALSRLLFYESSIDKEPLLVSLILSVQHFSYGTSF